MTTFVSSLFFGLSVCTPASRASQEVAELSYTIAGPHGQQITQPVDEMAFLDAAEDPSLVFNVKVVGSVTAVVHFPDDGRLRSLPS